MSASQSIVERRRCHAYWVSVNPLCRHPLPVPKHRTSSTLRPHAAALPRNSKVAGRSSRRLWLPYRVSPLRHRERPSLLTKRLQAFPNRSPLPRFLPLQRLAEHEERPNSSWDPSPLVTLHSQGFAPSQRFAPLVACRAYFIPVPLMGFSLRGFFPPLVPYVLSNAASLLRLVRYFT